MNEKDFEGLAIDHVSNHIDLSHQLLMELDDLLLLYEVISISAHFRTLKGIILSLFNMGLDWSVEGPWIPDLLFKVCEVVVCD